MGLGQDAAEKALIAFQRFGLGPTPGGPGRIGASPLNALLAELNKPGVALLTNPTLPTHHQACVAGQATFDVANDMMELELRARVSQVLAAKIGFVERLVYFWSNHFSMSVNKDLTVRATIGQLERDVIRRHALGSFADMLVGVMQHPAMICYLDNESSMGPNSVTGSSWHTGFNENLAREILELHTVGAGGGYTEADVTNFSKIITGWSLVRGWQADQRWQGGTAANRGHFIFRPDWHEPGPIRVMGKTYPASGIGQAVAVMRDLAMHPKTAEHLAFKMVLHFITDTPTPAMVEPLKRAYLTSHGNLKAMARALLELPEAWSTPLRKLRPPLELSIAQFRAVGSPLWSRADEWGVTEPLRALLQCPWEHGQPDGYPDESQAWLNPNAMRIRLDTSMLFVYLFTRHLQVSPLALAASLFDDALSAASRSAIASASDARHALAILVMTPEFQRR